MMFHRIFHSSVPIELVAAKNNTPDASQKLFGYELFVPDRMSFTITVPLSVPSLFHNSAPPLVLYAAKK